MKNLFVTIYALAMVLSVTAQGVCEPPVYYFDSKSNSGNGSVGSYYTFSNVLSSTNAVITITKLQNASISNSFMDVNSSYPIAWQPYITFPSSRNNSSDSSYIEFKVEFLSSITNTLSNQSCMAMTIVDCDGNGSNNGYREFAKVSMPVTPTGISGSSISVFQDSKWILFKSGPAVFNSIDTNNLAAMGQVNFPNNTNTFYMRVGVIGPVSANTQRQFSFYFKSFGLVVPLPVKLTAFDAVLKDQKVQLSWSSTEENKFSHYEVYKSIDGENFESIGLVASEKTATAAAYTFEDPAISHLEKAYYKLKMLNVNGEFAWSPIQLVSFRSDEMTHLAIYPSPSNGTLSIQSEYEGGIQLQILDAFGKSVYTGTHQLNAMPLNLDFKFLENGIYTILITDEQEYLSSFKWMKTSR